jgi:hypothetical protein
MGDRVMGVVVLSLIHVSKMPRGHWLLKSILNIIQSRKAALV